MKVSLDWLSQYIDIKTTPAELAKLLTMAGLEVEEIVTKGAIPKGVVAAKILERKPHPNADKLSVCSVDPGAGEPVQIVCGAPNCDAGRTVPLATLGTVFDDNGKPFEIKKAKLRGVESFGMMCSSKELGMGDDHSGLLVLPEGTPLGKPVSEIFKSDTVYTVEITPNRPDWLSHWGVARDIAALCGGSLKFPDYKLPAPKQAAGWEGLVEVQAPDLCPVYTARVIKGVKVKESPGWLKGRLESVGIRPINNIVDITNFVMLELGQPLHTFDLSLLNGGRIVVRRAAQGEKIVALDGKEYKLESENLVIADGAKPVAIAGVMGGEHSGILDSTADVLLESACFSPASVRATSRKLGLTSDSSYRFERGVDPELAPKASDRAAALILELAGGELVSGLVSVAAPRKQAEPIKCRFAKIRSLIGGDIQDSVMEGIFKSLGMEVSASGAGSCLVRPPSYRADILNEADLAEEVARINGLDKIPAIPVRTSVVPPSSLDAHARIERVRDSLIAAGLFECVSTSLTDERSALQDLVFAKEDLIAVANPISLDLAILRPSLLPGILAAVRHNVSRKNADLALFEIGRVFCGSKAKFPEERDECCIALTGRRHPERFSSERGELYDFYDLKGVVESFLSARRLESFSFAAAKDPRFVDGVCAELLIDGRTAGFLGEAMPELTKGMRLQTPLLLAVIQLDPLFAAKEKGLHYKQLSQFPPVSRDVAFVAPASLEHGAVVKFIESASLKNLEKVELFDIFTGASLGEGRKSMAYSLTFRAKDRTLTDDEVNAAHESLRSKLAGGLGVELR